MKAIRIHKNGGIDQLKFDDVSLPPLGENEVRVQIKASGLNHMDLWVRRGIPGIGALPLILGCDGAGVVAKLGSAVTSFKTGDRVFLFPLYGCGHCVVCERGEENFCKNFKIYGEHVDGTHAECIQVPEHHLIPLSDNLSFVEGAAFPLVFLTAWHMLVYNGQVKKGDVVLVMGASSGVGSAAVQIAKHFGATVIATAGSKDKLDHALALGADHVVNHYETPIAKAVKDLTNKEGANIIIEHVGEKVWDDCLRALAWQGKLVTCGATTGPVVKTDLRHIFIKQQQILGSTMGTRREMVEIHKKMAEGAFKPVISNVLPSQDVQEAHRILESSENFGKVVLSWE